MKPKCYYDKSEILKEYELVIVGGGVAGVCATVASAADVFCGLIQTPLDAWLFGYINDLFLLDRLLKIVHIHIKYQHLTLYANNYFQLNSI